MTLNEHLKNQETLDKERVEELELLKFQVIDDSSSPYYYLNADNIMEALDNTDGATGRISTFLIDNRSDDLMKFMQETSKSYWLAFVGA